MKKKIYALLLMAFATVSTAMAYDFMYEDIAYNINGDGRTVSVTYTSSQSPTTYSSKANCERKGIINYKWGEGMTNLVIPQYVTNNGKSYVVTRIGSAAFCYCDVMTGTISLPSTITEICDNAFYHCSGMTGNLNIPSGVIRVGEKAFAWCTKLDGMLSLPSTCGDIANYAFYNCEELKGNLSLPSNLVSIGEYAFYGCRNLFGDLQIPNTVKLVGKYAFYACKGFRGKLRFNCEVTNLPDHVFAACGFSSIELHDGITTIGDNAFDGCANLQGTLVMPYNISVVGMSAFRRCTMSGLTFRGNVLSSIGNSAFSECNGISTVNLPGSVTTIERCAFYKCENLTTINLGGAKTVDEEAFYQCKRLANVTLSYVQSIGLRAFASCPCLMSIHLPASLKSIGQVAFSGSNLSEGIVCDATTPPTLDNTFYCYAHPLTVPSASEAKYRAAEGWKNFWRNFADENGVRYRILDNNIDVETYFTHEMEEFNYPNLKGDITIPPVVMFENKAYNVVTIGYRSFCGAKGLTGVTLPNSVTKMDTYCFQRSGLKGHITIPSSVKEISSYVFSDCPGITGTVTIPASVEKAYYGSMFENCTGITGFSLLNTQAETIPSSMFAGCTGLTGKFSLPKHIKTINSSAFAGCSGFTGELSIPSNVTVQARAFENCTGFTGLYLPATLTKISEYAFAGCSGMKGTLHLPEGLQQVGEYAFQGCSGFEELDFPTSLTQIGASAFSGCNGLSEVYLPKNVTTLGESVFSECKGMKAVTIATSAKIPNKAFVDCTALRGVTNENTTPNGMDSQAFSNYNIPLYVPDGKVDAFKSSDWKLFNTIVVIGTIVQVPGDVNGDGEVNVSDVTALVNRILGAAEYDDAVCDIDGNGDVNVSDVTALINKILN